MKKILNVLFFVLKYILLVVAFGLSLMIVVQMNHRLDKSFITSWPVFLPYLLMFILFVVNMIFKQKGVNDCLFYNLTCCLVFLTVVVVGYRAIADKNMVLNAKYGYGIDFNYFNNFITYMRIMFYGLIIGNGLLMFDKREIEEE